MSTHDSLAPDQRAVLELVLRQGRSYGQLSELLGIPERDVRARADAGLRALAGEPRAGVDSGRIADWLLGQQPAAEAERTRAAVARDEAARGWAAGAAGRLRELGGGDVPEVPAGGEAPRRAASKLGGAILLGVALLVVGGVLAAVLLSRDEDGETEAADQARAQQEQRAQDEAAAGGLSENDIVLQGESGAQGVMRLVPSEEDGTVRFLLVAENLPPNQGREVYAVWFTRDGGEDARRLGFAQAQVGEDGILTTGGPQEGQEDRFARWFATYDQVIVTRETDPDARRPGPVVLRGQLPAGA